MVPWQHSAKPIACTEFLERERACLPGHLVTKLVNFIACFFHPCHMWGLLMILFFFFFSFFRPPDIKYAADHREPINSAVKYRWWRTILNSSARQQVICVICQHPRQFWAFQDSPKWKQNMELPWNSSKQFEKAAELDYTFSPACTLWLGVQVKPNLYYPCLHQWIGTPQFNSANTSSVQGSET